MMSFVSNTMQRAGSAFLLAAAVAPLPAQQTPVPFDPGPALVKDIRLGAQSGMSMAMVKVPFGSLGREVYFMADDGVTGPDLWKSDGTAAGTKLVQDFNTAAIGGGPDNFATLGSVMLFSAWDPNANSINLWRTDGTTAGTYALIPTNPGVNPYEIVVAGSTAFVADYYRGLWFSDGTPSGTISCKTAGAPEKLVTLHNKLYFLGGTPSGWGLCVSDGTDAGTYLIQALNDINYNPPVLEVSGGRLWCSIAVQPGVIEIWTSDGTSAGTVLLSRQRAAFPAWYFETAGNGTTLFSAGDGIHGEELWASDGTPAGTRMLVDINPTWQSTPLGLTEFQGRVWFAANAGIQNELWVSDGTAAGTMALLPGAPGPLGPVQFTKVNDNLMYFAAWDPINKGELWRTDGTAAGTYLAADNWPGGSSQSSGITFASGELFFHADDGIHGRELWHFFPGPNVKELGSSCAAGGADPRLSAQAPVLGSIWSLYGQGFQPGSGLWIVASPEATPSLVLGCHVYVDPLTAVLLHGSMLSSPTWSWTLPLPAQPVLTGATLSLQALQGPSGAALGIDLSNGLVAAIGL